MREIPRLYTMTPYYHQIRTKKREIREGFIEKFASCIALSVGIAPNQKRLACALNVKGSGGRGSAPETQCYCLEQDLDR
jgi:hypothetical protein